MGVDLTPLRDVDHFDIVNAIRNEGSNEYQQRIPEATQANIQDVVANLTRYRPQMNQFIDAFINQVGLVIAQTTSWNNPLAEFKKPLLNYGATIEEYKVDLVESHTYNHDRNYMEKDLFGQYTPRVKTNFHTLNREEYYPITVKEFALKRAILQPGQLTSLAGQILQSPIESDQWDEFLIMVNLFKEYERNGGFFKIQSPDLTSLDSTTQEARTTLRIIRAFVETLKFRSRKYNAAAMSSAAQPDELILFCTPDFKAALDVDALAGAFNLDKTEIPNRIITIPKEHFGIEGAQAILTTKDFFVVGDTLWQTTSQQNAVGLYHNYFLHHHQIVSASTFVPAILFTTHMGDIIVPDVTPVTGIQDVAAYDRDEVSVTEVERGELYTLTSQGITDGANNGVRWSLTGATSLRTYVTQAGVLHVAADETSDTITVKATTVWVDPNDPQKDGFSDTLVLTVTGEIENLFPEQNEITGITVEGVPVSPAFDKDTLAYTVIVPGGTTTADEIIVTGADGADITVTLNEAGDSFTVYNPTGEGDPTYTVTVN